MKVKCPILKTGEWTRDTYSKVHCGVEFNTKKGLAKHLQIGHGIGLPERRAILEGAWKRAKKRSK